MDSTRRGFLLSGLGLGLTYLFGCSSTGSRGDLPDAPWSDDHLADSRHGHDPSISEVNGQHSSYPTTNTSYETVNASSESYISTGFPNVMSRSQWSTGNPIPSRMDKMRPITRITVHHDGMNPFYSTSERDSKARIDAIRKAHQRQGWGDIGYHYVVDRSGRIWEARPLAYQGAHVKYHNEGNIGVMCLGNFERQSPSDLQLSALTRFLRQLRSNYRVPVKSIWTHQELRPTACPGRALQSHMVSIRRNGTLV